MVKRREFLFGSLAALGSAVVPLWAELGKWKRVSANLVPATPASSPNYWCTWATQNYMYGRGNKTLDVMLLEGDAGAKIAHNQISENLLFGPDGWAKLFYPKVRQDLYLLLDDGWAVGGSATFLLDEKKFPSFTGSPEERLRKLGDAICAEGWRGLALWCRDTPGGKEDERLVAWSRAAGVHYWKIDGGDMSFSANRARDTQHAPLTLEHGLGEGPLNGDWRHNGRFGNQAWDSPRIEIVRQSDVYRTYDTTSLLSIPTTLDRVAELLHCTQAHPEIRGILNAEDEVYIAAVLGCTMGVMRNPLHGERPGADIDLAFSGPRHIKRCIDEVVRAIRWQRIAAPYSVGDGFVRLDQEVLSDDWIFGRGDSWDIETIGQRAYQGAPACISRNLELPEVKCGDSRPFVFTARFPNGAAAIGAHGRMTAYGGWSVPKADVRWKLKDSTGPFGLFGYFSSVTLVFDHRIGNVQILAQDLAADHAYDITQLVENHGSEIVIPQEVIERIGLECSTPGDLSAPGLLVQFKTT